MPAESMKAGYEIVLLWVREWAFIMKKEKVK